MSHAVYLSEQVGPLLPPDEMGAPFAILGLQIGIVSDNKDPESRYRVKAQIPGVIDEDAETDWAMPLGTAGGGKQRGGMVVPAIGAKVGILFQNGDREAPFYFTGPWYDDPDNGGLETPQPAKDAAGNGAERVAALQIGSFTFAVDEHDDKLTFAAQAKDGAGGISIILDFNKRGIIIQSTSAIILKTLGLIHLDGLVVRLQDRLLATTSRPV